jgi:threonine/homoserine/homoserine lactone efflux protein
MTIEFFITSLIVVASPGTGVLYTLATGLSRGTRQSAIAAFGCTLGILPHIAAAITGLAAILHTSAVAFEILRYLGVAYLLYMAWRTLKEHGALTVDENIAPVSVMRTITQGILLNVLNPKLSIFFFAFLPQFVAPGDPAALWRMLELSAIFMLMTFVVFVIYGAFAAFMRKAVISNPGVLTWMRRSFAGAFALLGLQLAVSARP